MESSFRNLHYSRNRFTVIKLFLLLFVCVSCATNENPNYDIQFTRSHAAKSSTFWQSTGYAKKGILKKIYPAPKNLLQLLKRKPLVGSIKPYKPSQKAAIWAQKAIRELPHSFLNKVNPKLVGIFFVSGLKQYAITEYILGPDEQPLGAMIILDKKVLQVKANSFATMRAKSAFDFPDSDFDLVVQAAPSGKDSYKFGFQLILIEQMAKLLSIGETVHPPWDRQPSKELHPLDYSFSKISWTLTEEEDDYTLKNERQFPQRANIQLFHRSKKIDPKFSTSIYNALEKYSFANLPSVTSPSQDFAQSITTYIYTRLLGRPYIVGVKEKGRLVKRFAPCWTKPVCSKKEKIIRELVH